MDNLIKTGSCSIILGKNHYQGYIPYKINKLLKITNVLENHNEIKLINYIKNIEDYEKYYIIPDEEIKKLLPFSEFYNFLFNIIPNDSKNILNGNLYCYYVNYAGDYDLLDTINFLDSNLGKRIWDSYSTILNFSFHIMKGLRYLHNNKICHLDIKPENLMINIIDNTYKIIDFGFSSVEPFNDFVKNTKGTPGYFPKYISEYVHGLAPVRANDLIPIDGVIPIFEDRKLIYKLDSYAFGRVLSVLTNNYEDINNNYCCFYPDYSRNKLNKIKKLLLNDDVYKRYTINDVLNKYLE